MLKITIFLCLAVLIVSLLFNLVLFNKLRSKEHAGIQIKQEELDYAFSNMVNDPRKLLIESIQKANHTLDIAIYNFDDKQVAQAVRDAKKRGVKVRIITDEKKAKKADQSAIINDFLKRGIEVKINKSQKMHLKMSIIDEHLVVTGSYNYTKASATENIEQLITISNKEIAEKWEAVFTNLWKKSL